MEKRTEFLTKLNGLVSLAKSQGSQISIEEVKTYFKDIELTEEQMESVFDYLLSQKVVVKGYLKMDAPVQEEKLVLTEEEEANLLGVIVNKTDMDEYKRYRKDYDYFKKERFLQNAKRAAKKNKKNKTTMKIEG